MEGRSRGSASPKSSVPSGQTAHRPISIPGGSILSNTRVILSGMETISLKLTSAQARMIEKAARDSAFPSKSEFVRFAIARALEDKLSVGTIEEIFEARRQVRTGRTTPLSALKRQG